MKFLKLTFVPKTLRPGFTLIELVFAITLVALVSLAVVIPSYQSAKGLGPSARSDTLSLLVTGEAERVLARLAGLNETTWRQALLTNFAYSPITSRPDETLNGDIFSFVNTYSCVSENLNSADPLCNEGYARVGVTVTGKESGSYTITILTTAKGL